jgi:nucleoside-diphosphate-sugar epimerase
MRVLIAGATGAIGRSLVSRLLAADHEVAGLTRSEAAAQTLRGWGAEPHRADVFEQSSVIDACVAARPEVIVGQLTALPRAINLRRYARDLEPTNRLRRLATPNLIAGARAAGAKRLVVQSVSFITAPEGPAIHDETARIYDDAPTAFRPAVAAASQMEREVLAATDLDPVVLRYGFFYGPGTHYASDGSSVTEIRRRRFPVVGRGTGISSFLHIDDAASATLTALEGGASGLYNVTDDEPARMHEWVPFVAGLLGAKPPRRVPVFVARLAAGSHAVHFATTLRGNSNARFKRTFDWQPSHPSWREGFQSALSRGAS